MDAAAYKTFTTSRDIKYSYYFKKPEDGKPYLVFLHGFPSNSRDWKHQVAFFQPKGYGLIVPDLLGYGGTDKPTDFNAYRQSLMAKDIVELVDSENAVNAIAIGHDWGSTFTARIAARYPDRFLAFGFLAVGYSPPAPGFDYQKALQFNRETFGNEIFGYWLFFNEDDAPKLVNDHFDSFYSLLFCEDSSLWAQHISPVGACRKWLSEDKTTDAAKYLATGDKEERRKEFTANNMAGMNWYKPSVRGVAGQDDADIPEENYKLAKPVFFGGCLRDHICREDIGLKRTHAFCANLTSKKYNADHWVMLATPDELNNDLLQWITSVTASSK